METSVKNMKVDVEGIVEIGESQSVFHSIRSDAEHDVEVVKGFCASSVGVEIS
jgi:hypothetical protein